ncbi:uncharacterized protein [Halyomorpha halys]|uniref:uncharacterized protein n=1 Tax=Halyomorpha halys TaxID=286706 RepID=UPI0006D5042B|nr:uncharacterized protein LOC106684074 [Halyomorpha halys]XP_014281413.1 uncharacterized protein LOC106684074 [Halyomorpha halys]XP_014281414.1 uncharacterized protein LOC106684074 [Halyomorpha halys]XP_014281415.1 uncharacterized protein LOC106684074 [Halyomorpha halys]
MGVAKLYSFLKYIGALRKVNISEEADQYRRDKNRSPVIAVDGINLMYSLYSYHQISWTYGGQLKEYMEHLECFIESFQREGIDLIFFMDGANVMFNVDRWICRKRQMINEVHRFFDKIKYGINLDNFYTNGSCFVLPKNIWAVTIFVLKQKKCEIKITVAECDRELASFGRENDCMGILAADTDFIIYDTVKVFTTIRMDLYKMSFYVYEKREVLVDLMLKSSELPLFASLVGNDYTLSKDLSCSYFNKWSRPDNVVQKFRETAAYIRKLNLKIHYSKILKSDISKISKDFFGDEKMSEVLQESIDFYNIRSKNNGFGSVACGISDYKWQSIIRMFYKEFRSSGDILDILFRYCFQDCASLQDFRCTDIPPVSKVLKELRKKMYGILLFEKPGSKKVTEWLIDGYESLAKPDEVCPQFPTVHHPGLFSLLKGHNKEANWILLGDTFDLDPSYLKSMQEYLLIPALAFRYLKDKVIILKWEMNALILSAILVRYFNAKQLRWIKLDQVMSRPIRLYNLVTCSYEAVFTIFQIFGNLISDELALPSNYQDGKLFHLVYHLSIEEHMSLKEILNNIFDSYLKNHKKEIETSLELFDLMSSFIDT